MAFELPPLPYDYDALRPFIDAQTMHNFTTTSTTRPTSTNSTPRSTARLGRRSRSMRSSSTWPSRPPTSPPRCATTAAGTTTTRCSGEWMTPEHGQRPEGELAAAIDDTFGSFDDFTAAFDAAGVARFGSGWVWLIRDAGTLQIVSTANQDSPVTEGKEVLLGNDVWEHAYYLKYQNRRPEYLKAWWNVVNWTKVDDAFNA